MNTSETFEQQSPQQNPAALEAMIKQLTTRLETLEERCVVIEQFTTGQSGVIPTSNSFSSFKRLPKGYRLDPFQGLFGYYFVMGTLLLVFLGVVLALSNHESLKISWWFSAIALTLFQLGFLILGAWKNDRRTVMNAAIGLLLALLIDIGVIQFIGVASLREFFSSNGFDMLQDLLQ